MEKPQFEFLFMSFSAFAGAFFAFLFLRLSEFLTKIYQRQVKHYNSLVNLEVQLNEIGGIIHDNLYILPDFIRIIRSGNIYFNNLHQIPIDKSHYENLYDISLINELFSYNHQLRKINCDIATVSLGYQDIKNALIQKNMPLEDYILNANTLAEILKQLELFLSELQKTTGRLLARIRVQSRFDKPLGTRIMRLFIRTSGSNLTKDEIHREEEKLNKEMEEIKTKSQKEIEEVLKKYRNGNLKE